VAYIKNLFDKNFLEYASYVIKDRAIPDVEDGLKPVQRRIMHTLFDMDRGANEGRFNKVANVVGECMKYHPHGDASIGDALVVLANKEYFIERQGNFGNLFTGDRASAPRYIECRITPLAKDVFYNPKLTQWTDSYDGRNKEPVLFPAKIPVVLVIGAEGIAVGMSTYILPHNMIEVLEAEKLCLQGKKFQLFPDFQTGGLIDCSDYQDGNGKVLVRAKLDTSDPKRIVITELPFGSTCDSLMASVENAAKNGKLKIQSITDYTTDKVELEIKLARGVYSEETVDALYAFTECQKSLSCQMLVIKDGLPAIMTATEIIKYHAKQLVNVLTRELELEKKELQDKLHQRTLERIFIEERIYKKIETMKTAEGVNKAVIDGFKPFAKEVGPRGVSAEDVQHLLQIPIRRISLYDINKAKEEMQAINDRIKAINAHLKNIVGYAIAYLDGIIAKVQANPEVNKGKRRTQVGPFQKIDVKELTRETVELKYDKEKGYLGTGVQGEVVCNADSFDRVLIVKNNANWIVQDFSDKSFVGEHAWYIGIADKESINKIVFTIIYKDAKTGFPFIKRCVIEGWIMNREYALVPEGSKVLHVDMRQKFNFTVNYVKKPRLKNLTEAFKSADFPVRGLKAGGIRLGNKEVEGVVCKGG
jgi:topoisomerase-4 subunit A